MHFYSLLANPKMLFRGFVAVYLREILIMKRRIKRLVLSMSVSPLLYLIAFGYAMGNEVKFNGHTYLEFLIPGLISMSSMTQAFAISTDINVARFYWHIFEEFQAAPISNFSYVLGEVSAGLTRVVLSVSVIIVLGFLFGVKLDYLNPFLWSAVILNGFVFASLAVGLAMLVKSHADQTMLSSFVITPMAFLGGTFFPVERLPIWAQKLIYLLPITHATYAIRKGAFGLIPTIKSYIILIILGLIFFFIALKCVNQARD